MAVPLLDCLVSVALELAVSSLSVYYCGPKVSLFLAFSDWLPSPRDGETLEVVGPRARLAIRACRLLALFEAYLYVSMVQKFPINIR